MCVICFAFANFTSVSIKASQPYLERFLTYNYPVSMDNHVDNDVHDHRLSILLL